MTQKSYVINNFNKFAEDIRQAVAHAILKNSFPDQKNEVLDDLDSFITIYQVKEIIKNNALAVADDPVVDLKGMDNAWTQVNQGIFSAALSKLAASGDIECAWDDKANNMIFWPKEKAKVDQTSKVLKAGTRFRAPPPQLKECRQHVAIAFIGKLDLPMKSRRT